MTQYQCNVCAKIFGSFNDAALCHPDVNVLEDVPVQPNSRPTQRALDGAMPSAQCGCLAYECTGKLCGYCNRTPRQ